ncbi:MAG: RND family transporter [Xanthomonadales bacterium]|nr:MMPL family transporter [Gammaproteobacteria bacterium]MBT8053595.1 MMPL family transporter [Gammaproteobacteria bacterium]NND57674.1 RND family transporter [Xanthomonadales bacterium]NNK50983.1 RND family transporter [Xanthomonadales bacterium]
MSEHEIKDAVKGAVDEVEHAFLEAESIVERFIFGKRLWVLLIFLLATVYLVSAAIKVRPDASFEKMVPIKHPYIAAYLERKDELTGLGNAVRISVETTEGDIFTEEYMETLRQISDEVFFIPGVARSGVKSLWTPNVRWGEVTEEGFTGGTVVPDEYDGSEASLQQVRANVMKSGQVGDLVANDFRSTIILAPLMETNPETGEALNFGEISKKLEQLVRDKYQTDRIKIHMTGFAKVMGDLIDGAGQVAFFFLLALGITLLLFYIYSRCIRSSIVVVLCSVIAVAWQVGLLNVLGYGLDPYSMLIPFLVFAIGVSHGVQMINAIMHGRSEGRDNEESARYAFRTLYVPGLTALVSDGIGFATLMVIQIQVIHDLAIAASVGVLVVILTNLILLPVLMSYLGVGVTAIRRMKKFENSGIYHRLCEFSTIYTYPKVARTLVVLAIAAFAFGLWYGKDLKIGDLDAGAPELRADSRYNLDNKFIVENYTASTDVFVVMVQTEDMQCVTYETYAAVDLFEWVMSDVPGVQSAVSLIDASKRAIAGNNEGSPKWATITRNQWVLNGSVSGKAMPPGLMNADCNLVPVMIFLKDHKAETLLAVTAAIEKFKQEYDTGNVRFVMAAGNSGIEAATNDVVSKAQYKMLAWVYGVVSFLVLLAFRSARAVFCIVLPLALTSVLGQALMTFLGIGVKVATLPVIALGVGIGVDYGIYIFSKLETYLYKGLKLHDAYFETLKTTGKAVSFTGLTLAIGVATWLWSPIKFQGDMGLMLTFMFVMNMFGALILLPALVRLLIPTKKYQMHEVEEGRLKLESGEAVH